MNNLDKTKNLVAREFLLDTERKKLNSGEDGVRRHCVQYRRMEGSSSSMRHNHVIHRDNGETSISSLEGSTPSLALSESSFASSLSTSAKSTMAKHKFSQSSSSTTVYSATPVGQGSMTSRAQNGVNITTESGTVESSSGQFQLCTSGVRRSSLETKIVDQISRFRMLTDDFNQLTSPDDMISQASISEKNIQLLEDQCKVLEDFQQLLVAECGSTDNLEGAGGLHNDIYGLMQREGLPASFLLGLISTPERSNPQSPTSAEAWSPLIKPVQNESLSCPLPPFDDEPLPITPTVTVPLDRQPIQTRYDAATKRLELDSVRVFRKIITNTDLERALGEDSNSNDCLERKVTGGSSKEERLTNEEPQNLDSVVELVVSKSLSTKKNKELNREFIAIIENFARRNEGTCQSVIDSGGLDSVLFACRSEDMDTLHHAVLALANFSLYGGPPGQAEMVRVHAIDWLLPLAMHKDDVLRYYAFLTLVNLLCNRELSSAVTNLEILNLIIPFILSHDAEEFARDKLSFNPIIFSHDWLCRLIPALLSERPEIQAFAAFHFAAAASLKINAIQSQSTDNKDINITNTLAKVAEMKNYPAYKLAGRALELMGLPVPNALPLQVCLWTVEDVVCWISRIGFDSLIGIVSALHVDGDLLLTITEDELLSDFGITNSVTRRRFLRELTQLKSCADYSPIDPTGVSKVLAYASVRGGMTSTVASSAQSPQLTSHTISPGSLLQYAYPILSAGITLDALKLLSDKDLQEICNIKNLFHRRSILESVRASADIRPNQVVGTYKPPLLTVNSANSTNNNDRIDAFISYRRSNGSQLASLLKVHLQLRGYRVFLDIERLTGGRFDKKILQSIRCANNFILVLTPNALDRCKGDRHLSDWVHKEILCALESSCNIIPLTDRFTWPSENELPEDIRRIVEYNGIDWIHDYQDACIDKLVKFMNRYSRASRLLSSTNDKN